MCAPVVAALAVVPIVALAPVLYTMFGADSQIGRQAVAALAALIPVYVNTLRGLRQMRPGAPRPDARLRGDRRRRPSAR